MYFLTENHLQKMCQQGWRLVSYHGVKYKFKRDLPRAYHYFIYHAGGILQDEGKYSLTLRHWNIPETYGVSFKHSELNRFTQKTDSYIRIIEVDPMAVDGEVFSELIDDRRSLYFKDFLKKCSLLLLASVFFSVALRRYLLVTVFCTAVSGILLATLLMGVTFHIWEVIRQ